MALDNPAFSRNPVFNGKGTATAAPAIPTPTAEDLEAAYNAPSATAVETGRMTYDDVLLKSLLAFGLLLASAALAFVVTLGNPSLGLGIVIVGALGGLALGLVNTFKREPSAPLILLYTVMQGAAVGGISAWFELIYGGIVFQAVLGTFAVFGVTLALFASGKVRASKRATKVFLVAMVGYLLFSVVNIILMVTGVVDDPWGLRGADIMGIPLGIIIGVFVVLLAAYSLVLDFDFIKRGVDSGAPRKYGWTGAFGLVVTMVWLYLEILRILAIARD